MFNVVDDSGDAYFDEFAESASYRGRSYDEKLSDAIRLDEARQAALDGNANDLLSPVDDWMLD